MKRSRAFAVVLFVVSCASSTGVPPGSPPPKPSPEAAPVYPVTRRGEVVETRHGLRVADPYRWLEEDGAETRSWIAAQNQATDASLAEIEGRQEMRDRIADLLRHERVSLPFRGGDRYFWTHHDGKQEQRVVMTAPSLEGPARVLVDPNELSGDGRLVFAGFSQSDDGKRLAYGLAAGGGDWTTWRVRDVATGADLPEALEHVKYYRPHFTRDGSAIIYSRFPAPPEGQQIKAQDRHHKVYLHRLGTPVDRDVVLFERPDQPTWQFEPQVTRDGRYLVITIGDGQVGDSSKEQVAVIDLQRPRKKPVMLIDRYEEEYLFVGNEGPILFFKTTSGAANKRIIAIDLRAPERDRWKEIVPEGTSAIQDASLVGRQLFVTTLVDAHAAVAAHDLEGKKLRDVALPGIGTVFGFVGGPRDRETTFLFTSFTVPGAVHRYDLQTGATSTWKAPRVAFDPAVFETRQVFFPSKDGTKVPMFITGRKGLALDGQEPDDDDRIRASAASPARPTSIPRFKQVPQRVPHLPRSSHPASWVALRTR